MGPKNQIHPTTKRQLQKGTQQNQQTNRNHTLKHQKKNDSEIEKLTTANQNNITNIEQPYQKQIKDIQDHIKFYF